MNNEINDVFEDINNIFINKLQEAREKTNDSIEIELFNDCIDTYNLLLCSHIFLILFFLNNFVIKI